MTLKSMDKKKHSKLNMKEFPWTHQRTEFIGQTALLKCGERESKQ